MIQGDERRIQFRRDKFAGISPANAYITIENTNTRDTMSRSATPVPRQMAMSSHPSDRDGPSSGGRAEPE